MKEIVLASGPTSLLMALRKAKEAETAYELSGKIGVGLWMALIANCFERCSARSKRRLICSEDVTGMIEFCLGMFSRRVIDLKGNEIGKGLIEKGRVIRREGEGNEAELSVKKRIPSSSNSFSSRAARQVPN
jgi:hypothetical protein